MESMDTEDLIEDGQDETEIRPMQLLCDGEILPNKLSISNKLSKQIVILSIFVKSSLNHCLKQQIGS